MAYVGIKQNVLKNMSSFTENSCGPAAVACVVEAYSRSHSDIMLPEGRETDTIFASHPPDFLAIPGTSLNLGTTPWHEADTCKAYGLKTNSFSKGSANGIPWIQLKNALAARHPVLCMVDLGKLTDVWGAHWLVVFAYDDNGFYAQNANWQDPEIFIPTAQFEEAWHCWFVPWGTAQYAGIEVWYK